MANPLPSPRVRSARCAESFRPTGAIAYESNESGRSEIVVQPVPPTGAKWQVSTHGGSEADWPGDGREIFYLEGDKMMAVDVTLTPSFRAGIPKPLFTPEGRPTGGRRTYAVSPNGARFLIPIVSAAAREPFSVVVNWEEVLLKRR